MSKDSHLSQFSCIQTKTTHIVCSLLWVESKKLERRTSSHVVLRSVKIRTRGSKKLHHDKKIAITHFGAHFGGEKREILSVIIIIFNVFFFCYIFFSFRLPKKRSRRVRHTARGRAMCMMIFDELSKKKIKNKF